MKNIFSKSYFLFIKMLFACLLVCILYINILFALFVILFVCALISIVCTRKCENMTLSDKKFFIILFFVVVFVACVLCSYTSLYAAGSVWTWTSQRIFFFIILFVIILFFYHIVFCVFDVFIHSSLYAAGSVWTWPWQHDWCRVAQSQRQQVTTTPRWRNESLLWQTLHIDTRHRHNDIHMSNCSKSISCIITYHTPYGRDTCQQLQQQYWNFVSLIRIDHSKLSTTPLSHKTSKMIILESFILERVGRHSPLLKVWHFDSLAGWCNRYESASKLHVGLLRLCTGRGWKELTTYPVPLSTAANKSLTTNLPFIWLQLSLS